MNRRWYHHFLPDYEILVWLEVISNKMDLLLNRQENMMAAIDDLKAAIADFSTQLDANNAEIELLLTKITTAGTSDADIATAVQSIRGLITTNAAEVDKAKAAVPA